MLLKGAVKISLITLFLFIHLLVCSWKRYNQFVFGIPLRIRLPLRLILPLHSDLARLVLFFSCIGLFFVVEF